VVEVLEIQASEAVRLTCRLRRWRAAIVVMEKIDSAAEAVVIVVVVDLVKIAIRADSAFEATLLFLTGLATVAGFVPPEVFLLLSAQNLFLRLPLPHFRLPAGWPALDRNS
jgi:hypothetical protein